MYCCHSARLPSGSDMQKEWLTYKENMKATVEQYKVYFTILVFLAHHNSIIISIYATLVILTICDQACEDELYIIILCGCGFRLGHI